MTSIENHRIRLRTKILLKDLTIVSLEDKRDNRFFIYEIGYALKE